MQDGELHWETLFADALLSDDPVQVLRERGAQHIDEDGVRMAALLVVKLRFERLMSASPRAAALFEEDAGRFASLFRRYQGEVRSTSPMPGDERDLFDAWLAQESLREN